MGLLAAIGFSTPVLFRPPAVEKCARNGLDWLMREGGDYGLDYTEINPAILDVCHGTRCPLGQSARGGFGLALDLMGYVHGSDRAQRFNNTWLVQHGFLSGGSDRREPLNQAWRDLLAKELAHWASRPDKAAA